METLLVIDHVPRSDSSLRDQQRGRDAHLKTIFLVCMGIVAVQHVLVANLAVHNRCSIRCPLKEIRVGTRSQRLHVGVSMKPHNSCSRTPFPGMAYLQLLMRLTDSLTIRFLAPIVPVFSEEPHCLPVKHKYGPPWRLPKRSIRHWLLNLLDPTEMVAINVHAAINGYFGRLVGDVTKKERPRCYRHGSRGIPGGWLGASREIGRLKAAWFTNKSHTSGFFNQEVFPLVRTSLTLGGRLGSDGSIGTAAPPDGACLFRVSIPQLGLGKRRTMQVHDRVRAT